MSARAADLRLWHTTTQYSRVGRRVRINIRSRFTPRVEDTRALC